jgi:hypothetical protein
MAKADSTSEKSRDPKALQNAVEMMDCHTVRALERDGPH